MTTSNINASKTPCCGPNCCGGKPSAPSADSVRSAVREGYTKIAEAGSWTATQTETRPPLTGCCGTSAKTESKSSAGGGCCSPTAFTPKDLAAAIGYSESELAASPEGANMGLSCGNPTALASLKPGERVLDLGSGGGFDCFVAGPKVGASGRVIGVDMTPAMLSKARANIAAYTQQTGLNNVEFRLGEIENIPVADNSIDVVISNCVLNLSPIQSAVWKEIARVLQPGGRAAISDLVLLKPLPLAVRADVEVLVGCVAGAALAAEIIEMALAAGLTDVHIERKSGYVDAMMDWQDPLYKRIVESLPKGEKIGDYVTSANITAIKP